jgi:hypothetical protein
MIEVVIGFYILSILISIGVVIEHIIKWHDIRIEVSFSTLAFIMFIILVIFMPVLNLIFTKDLMDDLL